MSTAVLSATDLQVAYDDAPVVNSITIDVRANEVVGLLGPNGSGKSTTLLALSGLQEHQGGVISWFGDPRATPRTMLGRQLGFVPEQRSVFMQLSVHDNLRLSRGDIAYALELFPELDPLLRKPAGLLSGGEQQMLTLARTLSTRPLCLLADELSLGLAPLVVDRLLRAVRTAADEGLAVLLVEQHLHKALGIVDRAYIMRRGQIAFEGTTAEITKELTTLEDIYLSGD